MRHLSVKFFEHIVRKIFMGTQVYSSKDDFPQKKFWTGQKLDRAKKPKNLMLKISHSMILWSMAMLVEYHNFISYIRIIHNYHGA